MRRVKASTPSAEAEPDLAGRTAIWSDTCAYSTLLDATNAGWRNKDDTTTADTTSHASGSNLILPANAGLRLRYYGISNGSSQEVHAWKRPFTDTLAGTPGHALYFQFEFKFTPDPSGSIELDQQSPSNYRWQTKWVEFVTQDGSPHRLQFFSGNNEYNMPNLFNAPSGYANDGGFTSFHAQNADSATTKNAVQVRQPWLKDFTRVWNRATFKVMSASGGAGTNDAIAQYWLNGTLINSVLLAHRDVAVPGHEAGALGTPNPPVWCVQADLDAMYVSKYYSSITLGSVNSSTVWPVDIDYRNFVMVRD